VGGYLYINARSNVIITRASEGFIIFRDGDVATRKNGIVYTNSLLRLFVVRCYKAQRFYNITNNKFYRMNTYLYVFEALDLYSYQSKSYIPASIIVLIAPSFPRRTDRELDEDEEEKEEDAINGWDEAVVGVGDWAAAEAGKEATGWAEDTDNTKAPVDQAVGVWDNDATAGSKDNDDDSLYRDDGKNERETDKSDNDTEDDTQGQSSQHSDRFSSSGW